MRGTGGLVAIAVLALASPAVAEHAPRTMDPGPIRPMGRDMTSVHPTDATLEVALGERWHDVPSHPRLKLSVQITDQLTDIGNLIGSSMNQLSDDFLGVEFDGRRRRARVRVGTGEGELLRFRVDTDWHFAAGKARVVTKLQLGIGEHEWKLELPDVDVVPASYQGERGVEIRIPFYERRW